MGMNTTIVVSERKTLCERIISLAIMLCIVLAPLYAAENNILIFRNKGPDFEDAARGLSQELSKDFIVREVIVEKQSNESVITKNMDKLQPDIVVLMDNSAIYLYKKYQSALPENSNFVPSVSLMAVALDKEIKGLKNATGILYEIPIMTSAVKLRSLIGVPIKKIGVVHREYLTEYLNSNIQFCKKEGIEIKSVLLKSNTQNYSRPLKTGLQKLLREEKVDALWIANDNQLLTPKYFQDIWVPTIKKTNVPIIVGVEVLVQPEFNFGDYAVLPDHVSLGSQAAEIIFNIQDNDWKADMNVEQPISVHQILNLTKMQKKFQIQPKKLQNIDKVLK